MVIEDEKTLNSYSNQYEVEVSLQKLNDEMVSTLKEQVKTDISNLYNNIIAKKNWDAVKESYSYNNVNLSSLEEDYMDLYEDLNDDDLTLKKLEISSVTLTNGGIAVTTFATVDPVNVTTKISMVAMPSFERANEIVIIDTEI